MLRVGKFERIKPRRDLKVLPLKKLRCRPDKEVKLYLNLGQITNRLFYIMLAFFEHFSEAKALSMLVAFPRKLKTKRFLYEKHY